ncbi:MAG TPA: hypothetical protein DCW94_05915 [Porticoccaceae bacterium]|nr:hypothetical protein [Porticoccaceae bacterium]
MIILMLVGFPLGAMIAGMGSTPCSVTRRKYVPVGSTPASLLATVTEQVAEPMPMMPMEIGRSYA